MTSLSPLSADLLDRYFTGRCSADEIVRVRAALAQDPELRALAAVVYGGAVDVPAAWQRFVLDTWVQDAPPVPHTPRRERRERWFTSGRSRFSGVAAVVLTAIALIIWNRPNDSGTATRDNTQQYATRVGQIAVVRLHDGTTVTLAPNSTVSVARDLASGRRVVSLVGEARFNVVNNARAPFIVRSGGTSTRVLGTVFDVRHYASDASTRIMVLSGKITSQRNAAAVTLTAGMAGEFRDSTVSTGRVTDASSSMNWVDGRLVFQRMPVLTALETLHHWYGYQFQLADTSLASGYLTGIFTLGQTDEMMRRLKSLLGVRLTFQDSVVTLHPDRSAAGSPRLIPGTRRDEFSSPAEVGR